MIASYFGNYYTVNLLIHKGANIEAEDRNGATAITYAYFMNYHNIVNLLISRGAIKSKMDKIEFVRNNYENGLI